jgi:hypothetical protein
MQIRLFPPEECPKLFSPRCSFDLPSRSRACTVRWKVQQVKTMTSPKSILVCCKASTPKAFSIRFGSNLASSNSPDQLPSCSRYFATASKPNDAISSPGLACWRKCLWNYTFYVITAGLLGSFKPTGNCERGQRSVAWLGSDGWPRARFARWRR